MERIAGDCDYAEDLCRVYKEIEHAKAVDLDMCGLILESSLPDQGRREWVPASEWTRDFKPES